MKYITTVMIGDKPPEHFEDKDLESVERRTTALQEIHGYLFTEVNHVGADPETGDVHILVINTTEAI